MNLFFAVLIGAVLGAIDGAGIFFAAEEPYKLQIFLAATLKGAMVGILAGFSLTTASRWWVGLALGAVYGLWKGAAEYSTAQPQGAADTLAVQYSSETRMESLRSAGPCSWSRPCS